MPASISTPSSRFEEILDNTLLSAPSSPPPAETAGSTPSTQFDYPWAIPNRRQLPRMPPPTPEIFRSLPVLRDIYPSSTSFDQDATVSDVLPLLASITDPLPSLNRTAHIEFLKSGIGGRKLSSFMVALDASRPWIVYWCLTGLSMLGADISKYCDQVISTFQPLQNPSGGFGGGHQQFSHIAPTYAAVLSLASVDASSLSMIDRRSMVRWLHSLKNADGSFSMCVGGEIDVRGIYCALAIISLLRLPTDSGLLSNTTRYLASCQTYEGGFASNFGGTEAHGGYAFCALAALCILHPPTRLLEIVDMDALVRWLSARQYAPEGGISGRTNKLVDGCYSTWVGGCWALVEAALEVEKSPGGYECLWSREGLIRYILTAAQSPQGGLRDKPGKGPDYYHSAYILLGLSTAMHYYYYDENAASRLGVGVADPKPLHKGNAEEEEGMPLMAPFAWKFSYELPGQEGSLVTGFEGWPDVSWRDDSSTHDKQQQGGEGGEGEMGMKELKGDRVAVLHPLFNIRYDCVLEAKIWADGL